MASVKLAMITSSVEGFHVYRGSPDIGEKVTCTGRNKQIQQHSNQSCWDANETIGHVPNGLWKVVTPSLQ